MIAGETGGTDSIMMEWAAIIGVAGLASRTQVAEVVTKSQETKSTHHLRVVIRKSELIY
jgi:hypothetical protein